MSKRYLPALIVLFLLVTAAAGFIITIGADGRTPITALEFDPEKHVLRVFGDVVPPVLHDYPDVVATVNGEKLTGDDLMERQVRLVADRLTLENVVSRADDEFAPLFEQFDRADPLELVIEEALIRQAVLREGTRMSREEAQESLRDNEAHINNGFADDPPEQRAEFDAMLIAIGYPLRDWAGDDRIVENLRMQRGIGTLAKLVCDSRPDSPFERDFTRNTGYDCTAFLAAERAAADIEVSVRWVD